VPVVALHPGLADQYREQIGALTAAAITGTPESQLEVVPKNRELIDRVVVTPAHQGHGVEISIEGRLAAILALATGRALLAESAIKVERVKGIEPSS
jgi:site-specific DNA recombinase